MAKKVNLKPSYLQRRRITKELLQSEASSISSQIYRNNSGVNVQWNMAFHWQQQ